MILFFFTSLFKYCILAKIIRSFFSLFQRLYYQGMETKGGVSFRSISEPPLRYFVSFFCKEFRFVFHLFFHFFCVKESRYGKNAKFCWLLFFLACQLVNNGLMREKTCFHWEKKHVFIVKSKKMKKRKNGTLFYLFFLLCFSQLFQ